MRLPGERYELEMNMLLALKDLNIHHTEVPIETIYIDNNSGSHFNPLRDGLRIFKQIITYMCSSLRRGRSTMAYIYCCCCCRWDWQRPLAT